MPRRARRQLRKDVMSSPLKWMRPAEGRMRPAIMLTKVVLPAPLGPMTARISLAGSSKSTARTACTPPKCRLNPWVCSKLMGGVGTALGPLIGTGLMFYLVDFASEITSSYLIVVGVVLVLLVLVFPKGLIGTLQERWPGVRS